MASQLENTIAVKGIVKSEVKNFTFDARVDLKKEESPFSFTSVNSSLPQKLVMVSTYDDFLFPDLYEKMCNVKSHIDEESYCRYWDKAKRKTNPYELVHVMGTNQSRDETSLTHPYPEVYSPLSRAFFKMLEIYDICGIIPNYAKTVPGAVANLAEGPGGFLEGVHKRRKTQNLNDIHHAITLFPRNRNIPGWSQLLRRKKHPLHCKNVFLHTGNLYKTTTLYTFAKKFSDEKAFLVTGDGGFDYSRDFNNQEKSSFQIVFAEVTTALMIQKQGGTFICKMFDLFTYLSAQMIYLLSLLYDEVIIFKPKTSRPANSEKYLIAKGFRGIQKSLLTSMIQIVNNWQSYADGTDGTEKNEDSSTTDVSDETPSPVMFEAWRVDNPFQALEPKLDKKRRVRKKNVQKVQKVQKVQRVPKVTNKKTGMVIENLHLPPTFIQELRMVNEMFARRQERYIVATLDYIKNPTHDDIRNIQSSQATEWFTIHKILTKQEIRVDFSSLHLNASTAPVSENVQDLRGKVKEEITEKIES